MGYFCASQGSIYEVPGGDGWEVWKVRWNSSPGSKTLEQPIHGGARQLSQLPHILPPTSVEAAPVCRLPGVGQHQVAKTMETTALPGLLFASNILLPVLFW